MQIDNTRRMGDVVQTLGTSQFANRFYRLFDELLGLTQCTVFAFSQSVRPESLFAEGCNSKHRVLARALAGHYVRGGFERDANLARLSPENPGKPLEIFSASARDIKDRVYRRRFYEEPGLRGKLVMRANVGATHYYVNFYRGPTGPDFTAHEIDSVRVLSELALHSLERHRQLCATERVLVAGENHGGDPARGTMFHHLRERLLADRAGLTQREAEVCAGILLGHGTQSLGLLLGISPHTVATHRKRAYAKLGISSQSGLFARYLCQGQ